MFGMLMSKFLLNKNTIGIVVILAIVGYVAYKINSLENQLEQANMTITSLTKDMVIKEVVLANRDNLIANMTTERNDLIASIDNLNKETEESNKRLTVAKEELNIWMNKPPEVKFKYVTKYITKKVNYDNATCKEGKELMLRISDIKYEDL